jgi:hypothetical protein
MLSEQVRRAHIATRRAGGLLRSLLSRELVGTVAVLGVLFASFNSFAGWVSTNVTLTLLLVASLVNNRMFSAHLGQTKFGEGAECEVDTLDPNLSVCGAVAGRGGAWDGCQGCLGGGGAPLAPW